MISNTGPGLRAQCFHFPVLHSWRISNILPKMLYYVGLNAKVNKSSADHQVQIISKWHPLSNLFTPLNKQVTTILDEMLILSQKAERVSVLASLASAARAGLRELHLWRWGLFCVPGRMWGDGHPCPKQPLHLTTVHQPFHRLLQPGIFFPSDVPTYQDIKGYYIT